MSLMKSAFRGGIWYGGFTTVSQAISWCATLVVARLLMPGDYGLMAMATILTGYVQVFYEMGVGSAIVQRETVSDDELSSLFWALVFWGALLSLACFFLAYPTVAIFDEPRLFHITQAVSMLFVLGASYVVPSTLLKRQLRFKALGFITSASVIVSCSAMIAMAYHGTGVWTLVAGVYFRSIISLVLVFYVSGWRPKLRFRHWETVPYLRFGLPVVGGQSLHYVYSRAAVFFGGLAFSPADLGQYSLALQLAYIPNDKILSLINSVSYPVFARMQNDDWEFRRFYLRLSQLVAFLVLPLYCGGLFVADDLIPWVLGEKWLPSVLPFQLLSVALMVSALASPSDLANTAQGRPHWGFWFHAFCAATMTGGFYLAAAFGRPAYLAIPWLVVYLPAQLFFCWLTLNKIGVSPLQLAKALRSPVLATASMLLMLVLFRYSFSTLAASLPTRGAVYLALSIGLGAAWYASYCVLLHRSILQQVLRLVRG